MEGGAGLRVGEYERWMEAARRTLDSARGDHERGDYNWACFKAQQAAEMAVKALLNGIGTPRRGRSVTLLLRFLGSLGVDVPDDVAGRGALLDKYYIPARYPDAWSEGPPHIYFTERESLEAIECASKLLGWVEGFGGDY